MPRADGRPRWHTRRYRPAGPGAPLHLPRTWNRRRGIVVLTSPRARCSRAARASAPRLAPPAVRHRARVHRELPRRAPASQRELVCGGRSWQVSVGYPGPRFLGSARIAGSLHCGWCATNVVVATMGPRTMGKVLTTFGHGTLRGRLLSVLQCVGQLWRSRNSSSVSKVSMLARSVRVVLTMPRLGNIRLHQLPPSRASSG
jgi:hypothetical protein